jgi:hypothetical protein
VGAVGAGPYRPVLPLLRFGLQIGVVFTAIAGFSLFFLSRDTDQWFAWTIAVPMTAAFIGIFYLMAMAVALLTVQRQEWAQVRAGLPGVLVFLWATALATAVHLDQFHFGEGTGTGQVAAWVWAAVYVIDPILLTVAFVQQVRQPGGDRPRTARLATGYRAALSAAGVTVGGLGIALFVAPAWADAAWPWPLTALTARMIAAWLLGSAGVLLAMAWEDDAPRIRAPAVALVVFGSFQLLALARFSADFRDATAGLVFAAVAVLAVVLGLVGIWPRKSAAGRGKTRLAPA